MLLWENVSFTMHFLVIQDMRRCRFQAFASSLHFAKSTNLFSVNNFSKLRLIIKYLNDSF